jgi:hypothetical protein
MQIKKVVHGMQINIFTQRRPGVSTEKKTPDRTSFATNMHFIVSDKNNVNFKGNIRELKDSVNVNIAN